MLLNTFDYVRPNGLGEVLETLDRLKHTNAHVIAGGTDLIPALRGQGPASGLHRRPVGGVARRPRVREDSRRESDLS